MAEPPIETEYREAVALRQAGRYEESVRAYRRVLARNPALPDCWYNVGWMERRLGRPEAALAAYAKALEYGANGPEEVHLNRGVIFMDDLNRVDDAEREYRAALARSPDYVPALLNLANLEEDRGARAEAGALYERLLAVDPQCWEGLARAANLRSAFTPGDAILTRLSDALSRNDLDTADRASLGFALGRARDLVGDHGGAFDAYAAANRASAEGEPGYDPEAHERLIDRLIATFAAPAARQADEPPAPTVFICGMFRSGSTLLEQALTGHPALTAGGEIPALPTLAAQIAPFPEAAAEISDARRRSIAEAYRTTVSALHPGAGIVTDKRPDNFLLIGLAKRLFPDAKILHSVRDPLDTCLSIYFLHLDHSMAYAKDLRHIAHYYAQYRRLMAHWKALYPADIHDFDYDAFVRAPRAALEPALGFLGLGWDERCLVFHERASLVRTASVWQVREPLYQRSSGRAQKYMDRIGALRDALARYYPAAS
jgi:tetratricopeptide (TPR) repeat protein